MTIKEIEEASGVQRGDNRYLHTVRHSLPERETYGLRI